MFSLSRLRNRNTGSGATGGGGGGTTPPPTDIPKTWNDARFSANTPITVPGPSNTPTVTSATYTNNTWDDAPLFNTPPDWDSGPVFYHNGAGTVGLAQCRLRIREGLRSSAPAGSVLNITECYIECVGRDMTAFGAQRPDHADGYQAVSGFGTVNISKTCFRSYTPAEAQATFPSISNVIGSQAIMYADDSAMNVNLTDVIIWGGERGVFIHADSGTTTINFNRVYFVPSPDGWPSQSEKMHILVPAGYTGTLNVAGWTDVYDATIVNGVIVPGNPIPAPIPPFDATGPFTAQTGVFTISFDAVPDASPQDSVCGLSNGVPAAFTSFACAVQFWTTGNIQARNGGAYAAAASIPYSAGLTYRVRMVVNVPNHTYDVFIKPPNQSEITLGTSYAFRTEQSNVSNLSYLGKMTTTGGVTVSNVSGPTTVVATPVVNNQTLPELLTTGSGWVAGKEVGTVVASYSPTSFAFSPANSNLAISSSGTITVTSAGITAYGNTTGNLTVGVTATNTSGTSPVGTITIPRTTTAALAYPKSFTDPMFTSMVERTTVMSAVAGTTYNNYSWANMVVDDFSGQPAAIMAASNTTWNKLRIKTNEGFRFGGQTNVVINQMYMEISDPDPAAHSDGTQWYLSGVAPPGSGSYPNISRAINSLTIKNSHIRALAGCYTLMLIADWSCGTISFENCLFTSIGVGCQGFVFNPQTSTLPDTVTVSVKDCWVQSGVWGTSGTSDDCFAIATTTGAAWYIHPCTVSLWSNVNYCTWNHSTGVLTPGAAYPKPAGVL